MQLLQHRTDIARNTVVGTNGRRGMATLHTGVSCLFMPMNSQTAVSNGFTLGKAYTVFFDPGTNVNIGDRLVRNGHNYSVKAVLEYEVPVVGHVRALCEREGGDA